MTDTDATEAGPDDVEFSLNWQDEDGALKGALQARNVSEHRVRLSGKPHLIPLDADGNPLEAESIMTLELRLPGYAELGPGESATSQVGWAGWDGPAAGGIVRIEWSGGQADVPAAGPRQPSETGPATNLWSSWFDTDA
ncbi:MAG TPA: DUF4232 domain-containing protein [Jatrophihabitans sp.]|jgi:hypothetical protein|uniref:DUF4232 domain-containing protein n=1 Tax=Jatrophihabitans sp. TaxID=1932789 RepID=UPI002EEADE51